MKGENIGAIADDVPDVTGECDHCGEALTENDSTFEYREWGETTYDGSATICEACAENRSLCEHCSISTDRTEQPQTFHRPDTTRPWLCYACLRDDYYQCVACDEFVVASLISDRDSDYCVDCYTCECFECGCDWCYPDGCDCGDCRRTSSEWIEDYSYKPEPNFHHVNDWHTKPVAGTPYLGMELEIDISDADAGACLVTRANSDLIYCKEDSSVDGFEMVTHPMTLAAAKALLPFSELRMLRKTYRASAWNNGIHVHVSRDGFSSDVHVYRWMKLFYRNADDVKRIARRDSAQWASFNDESRRNHKYTAERRKGQRSYGKAFYTRRYSAINVENYDTFEVRVFRGSLRRDEILACLELVAASVEYTRQLTTADIMRNNGWAWDRFILWASAQGDTYENLVELDRKTFVATQQQLDLTGAN